MLLIKFNNDFCKKFGCAIFTHLVQKDHLGNNRMMADGSGNAVALHDHGPAG